MPVESAPLTEPPEFVPSPRKQSWYQQIDAMSKGIPPPLSPPPPPVDDSRPWLQKPEPQIATFKEPAEWSQAALDPIEEELPVPEGFVRRKRNRN
jgi:hypothetical protein